MPDNKHLYTLEDIAKSPEMQDLLYRRLDNELAWKKVAENAAERAGRWKWWGATVVSLLAGYAAFKAELVQLVGWLARITGAGK